MKHPQQNRCRHVSLLATLALLGFSTLANAADGVIEINQTCAVNTGCNSVDQPGFPVTIGGSGSFILTSDLLVPALVTGITTQIYTLEYPERLEVSIDLNGFTISSDNSCTNEPSCDDASGKSGHGILIQNGSASPGKARVHGGTIRNMAGTGVLCPVQCDVADIRVAEMGHDCMFIAYGTVRSVNVTRCYEHGVEVGIGVPVENSVASDVRLSGFIGQGTFRGNSSFNNGVGFNLNRGVAVYNDIYNNDIGIYCASCVARANNISEFVKTTGIDFFDTAGLYGGNLIRATTPLANAASAVQDGVNLCNGSACP